MNSSDTIVAIATPPGIGGIAVVRISGPDALAIVSMHIYSPLHPRHATYCRFGDIDDGIAVYYPCGYTGEPTVEFSCHGSQYVQQAVVQALVDSGARLAEPGEFTMRAFLNGRLDLSQAEAVADLIDAVTPQQHRLAVSQLRGGYAHELKAMRQQLLDLTSLLELELDFSQEDVEFADRSHLMQLVEEISLRINSLRGTFRVGNALKRGIPTAIIGRPNAGKSSLLNALLVDNRAIVSPIAGTTRDTVEETFNIDGITFRLIDTAGLHRTDDPLESMGIERSLRAIDEALIIINVHDVTTPWHAPEINAEGKRLITVLNKCDLVAEPCRETPLSSPAIRLSIKEGWGLAELKSLLAETARSIAPGGDGVLLTNVRHYDALGRAYDALRQVAAGLADGIPADLVAIDLRDALYHLGTITGDVTNDEVLGNIFSRFCIGK